MQLFKQICLFSQTGAVPFFDSSCVPVRSVPFAKVSRCKRLNHRSPAFASIEWSNQLALCVGENFALHFNIIAQHFAVFSTPEAASIRDRPNLFKLAIATLFLRRRHAA
jgi:hypothetical protein